MPSEKRVFRSSEFVNRKSDIEWALNIIKARKKGVLTFEGDKGSGKTTLLFELYRLLSLESEFAPFLISLSPYSAPEFDPERSWVRERYFAASDIPDVMNAIVKGLKIESLNAATGDLQKDHLARSLAFRDSSGSAPIILVDSIYECEEQVRNEIERVILTPLLASERVFIVLSGRGKPPIWSRPELQNAETRALLSLGEEHVKELLEKMKSPHADEYKEIYRLSGGYPLLVRLMGDAERSSDKSLLGALSDAIDAMLKEAAPEEARDDKRYSEFREQVEKLSLVGIELREADVQEYLYPKDERNERRLKTRKLFNILLQANLLRFESKGYKLNDSISNPARTFLREYKPSVYEEYLAQLRKVSEKMQEEYPNAREWYRSMAPA